MTRLEQLTFDTLMDNVTNDDLPEGGFIMDDSELLVFVPYYFEDEMKDIPDEDNVDWDKYLLADDGIESTLDEEEF